MYIDVQDKVWKQVHVQIVITDIRQTVWTTLFVRINSLFENEIENQIHEDLEDA
jgi:hypothetical protein